MSFLSKIKSSTLFEYLRRLKYRSKRRSVSVETLSITQLSSVLTNELGIRQGDSIFVHCGFGFLNADFSPQDLIVLLKDIVGPDGHIMMPFYPPGLSCDWAKAGRTFDAKSLRCSTGVLSQAFSADKDIFMSIHPIKAVCVWGPKAEELISEHYSSVYPFDECSPYFKFSQLPGSKSIGLGVDNCSMIHCAEDVYEENKNYLYSNKKINLNVIEGAVKRVVPTYYHHGNNKLMTSHSFFQRYCPSIIKSTNFKGRYFYCVNNSDLLSACSKLFGVGVTRLCQ